MRRAELSGVKYALGTLWANAAVSARLERVAAPVSRPHTPLSPSFLAWETEFPREGPFPALNACQQPKVCSGTAESARRAEDLWQLWNAHAPASRGARRVTAHDLLLFSTTALWAPLPSSNCISHGNYYISFISDVSLFSRGKRKSYNTAEGAKTEQFVILSKYLFASL